MEIRTLHRWKLAHLDFDAALYWAKREKRDASAERQPIRQKGNKSKDKYKPAYAQEAQKLCAKFAYIECAAG